MNDKTLNTLAVFITVLVGLMVVVIITNSQNNKVKRHFDKNISLSQSVNTNPPVKSRTKTVVTSLKVKKNLTTASLKVAE
jgi:UTP-glucose-1-phosphate uridylyltransferase